MGLFRGRLRYDTMRCDTRRTWPAELIQGHSPRRSSVPRHGMRLSGVTLLPDGPMRTRRPRTRPPLRRPSWRSMLGLDSCPDRAGSTALHSCWSSCAALGCSAASVVPKRAMGSAPLARGLKTAQQRTRSSNTGATTHASLQLHNDLRPRRRSTGLSMKQVLASQPLVGPSGQHRAHWPACSRGSHAGAVGGERCAV